MPVYHFVCEECDAETTVVHGFLEDHPSKCACGGKLRHKFIVPNVIYRGSGFYSTDKALYETDDN